MCNQNITWEGSGYSCKGRECWRCWRDTNCCCQSRVKSAPLGGKLNRKLLKVRDLSDIGDISDTDPLLSRWLSCRVGGSARSVFVRTDQLISVTFTVRYRQLLLEGNLEMTWLTDLDMDHFITYKLYHNLAKSECLQSSTVQSIHSYNMIHIIHIIVLHFTDPSLAGCPEEWSAFH